MTLRQYLITMSVGTIFCWGALGLILLNVDPFEANTVHFLFFYASLFLALLGTGSLLSFGFYHFFSREDLPLFRFVERGFQHGFVVSVALVTLLLLRAEDLLTLWTAALLILLFFFGFFFTFSLHRG